MLKPGGDMLLTFLAYHPLYEIYENMGKNNKWSKYMQNLKQFVTPLQNLEHPEKYYDKLLRKIGFNVHLCKTDNRKYTYANLEVLRSEYMTFLY